MFIYLDILSYYKLFLYINLCLSVKLDSLMFIYTHIINVKEQLVVRKDMDVNEHERLSNITLRHKLMQRNSL
jgi:hypothetical protein